jgi:hypothetical protein
MRKITIAAGTLCCASPALFFCLNSLTATAATIAFVCHDPSTPYAVLFDGTAGVLV